MTRIDISPTQDRDTLKDELRQEIVQERRRKRLGGCLGCGVVMLILIIAPLVFAATMVAKTGFVRIPFISNIVYKPESPRRVVQPVALPSSEWNTLLRSRGKINRATNTVTIAFTEGELTDLLQKQIAMQDTSPSISSIQAAIDPSGVELFATLQRQPQRVPIKIVALPSVSSTGAVTVTAQSVVVGSLRIPDRLVGMLVKSVNERLESALASAAGEVRIIGIALEQGRCTLTLMPRTK